MKGLARPESRRQVKFDSEGSWAISYGDMVTLLLAFFILFFSVDPQERDNKVLQESLLARIYSLENGAPSQSSITPGQKQSLPNDVTVKEYVKKWGARIEQVGVRLYVEFPDISFFDSGETALKPESIHFLQDFAAVYVPFSGQHTLSVLGFTDDIPVRRVSWRAFQDNLELSALRAVSAERVLQNAGIPLARMRLSGFGVRKPPEGIPDEESEKWLENWRNAQARKIVLVVEPDVE